MNWTNIFSAGAIGAILWLLFRSRRGHERYRTDTRQQKHTDDAIRGGNFPRW